MVVGGEETVVTFDLEGEKPAYYASQGASAGDDPSMTCYLTFNHHTEFPRRYGIPFMEGLRAVREFLDSGGLPRCINWDQVARHDS
jgi:hypothetical protein